jgi:hypothetical protein
MQANQAYTLELTAGELAQLSFEDPQGKVGVASSYEIPLEQEQLSNTNDMSIQRSYSVNGNQTNQFSATDVVKVTLLYSLKDTALDGCYQITDILPAGLRIVNKPYARDIPTSDIWYPYEITGQKASFCVTKNNTKPVQYYARVVSQGEYKAEPAIIQSLQSVQSFITTKTSEGVSIR